MAANVVKRVLVVAGAQPVTMICVARLTAITSRCGQRERHGGSNGVSTVAAIYDMSFLTVETRRRQSLVREERIHRRAHC
jgi:hypothetical protein